MRQIVRLSFAVAATVVAAGSLFAVPAWDYRVESITIPKGSYFDTGYCPGEHPYAWVKFTTVPGSVPFGTQSKADGAFMLIHSSDKKLYYRYGRKDSEGATAAYEANQVLSVACYEQMLVNGEKKSGGATGLAFTETETVTVPGRAAADADAIIHGFRLWDGETLKCEFIPCVKDGTACFYDTVTETFLCVTGGGTVTSGTRVDDEGRKIYAEADTITISIASGTTDLVDWMAANGIESISGDKLIVKDGAGTLVVASDVLSAFTGDVHIDAGRVRTSVANPLGPASSGKVYVKSGATLETTWAVAGTEVSFGNKPVYIAGTGTDGNGAIYVDPLTGNKSSGHPGVVYLTADAKGGGSRQTRIGGKVYLEGHLFDVDYTGSWTYLQQTYYDTTGRGNLSIAREILWEASSPGFKFGNDNNTVYIRNGGAFRTNSYTQDAAFRWRMVYEGSSRIYCGGGTSTWYGEVVLEGAGHKLDKQNNNARHNYRGKITGPGGIGTSGNVETDIIGLYSASNDFKGGVYLKVDVLHLDCNGALPADGAALTNVSGSVLLASQTDFYDLPEAYFSKTGMVKCTTAGGVTRGAWRKCLTKADAGELVYDTLVGSSNLVVKGGSVRFPVTAIDAELPVFTNVQVRTGASVAFGEGYAGAWAVPNLKSGGGTIDSAVTAGDFVVDAAAASETLTVSGALTFAAGAQVEVPAALPHRGKPVYTLVTAPSIVGLPKSVNDKWYTQIVENANGTQSLQLVYGVGLSIFLR